MEHCYPRFYDPRLHFPVSTGPSRRLRYVRKGLLLALKIVSSFFRRHHVHLLKIDTTLISLATICLLLAMIIYSIGGSVYWNKRNANYSVSYSTSSKIKSLSRWAIALSLAGSPSVFPSSPGLAAATDTGESTTLEIVNAMDGIIKPGVAYLLSIISVHNKEC